MNNNVRDKIPKIGIVGIIGCLLPIQCYLNDSDIITYGCSIYLLFFWDIIGVIIYLYNIVLVIKTKKTLIWKPIIGAILCVISIAVLFLIVFLDPHLA